MAREQERFAPNGPCNTARTPAKNGAETHPALLILARLLARHAAEEDAAVMQKGQEHKD